MSAPLVPSPLDYIGRRPFAFYPAIGLTSPNEWLLGAGSLVEVQVINVKTGAELWVPRQYVGAVSDGDLLPIVGLTASLEYLNGQVQPKDKRVLQMPPLNKPKIKPQASESGLDPNQAAPVVAIRLHSRTDSRLGKTVLILSVAGLIVSLLYALMTAAIHF